MFKKILVIFSTTALFASFYAAIFSINFIETCKIKYFPLKLLLVPTEKMFWCRIKIFFVNWIKKVENHSKLLREEFHKCNKHSVLFK